MGSSQIINENKTSRSGKVSPLSASGSGSMTLQKGNNGRVVIKLPNTNSSNSPNNNSSNQHHPYSFGNGSSPLFSATQPYIATPLQPSNIPGGPFQQNASSFLAQRQAQQYQQMSFKKQTQTVPLTSTFTGRPPTFSGPETSNGPPTGSLPSKFVHDLMSNSPNVSSISMFPDWSMGPNSAKPGNTNSSGTFPPVQPGVHNSNDGNSSNNSNDNNNDNSNGKNNGNSNNSYYSNNEDAPVNGAAIPEHTSGDTNNQSNSSTYDAAAAAYNGNTGLTPYINTAQTPLGTKFFNFSTDISGEKNSSKI